jgi:hypothetical protein
MTFCSQLLNSLSTTMLFFYFSFLVLPVAICHQCNSCNHTFIWLFPLACKCKMQYLYLRYVIKTHSVYLYCVSAHSIAMDNILWKQGNSEAPADSFSVYWGINQSLPGNSFQYNRFLSFRVPQLRSLLAGSYFTTKYSRLQPPPSDS